jgi:hypothetical protein
LVPFHPHPLTGPTRICSRWNLGEDVRPVSLSTHPSYLAQTSMTTYRHRARPLQDSPGQRRFATRRVSSRGGQKVDQEWRQSRCNLLILPCQTRLHNPGFLPLTSRPLEANGEPTGKRMSTQPLHHGTLRLGDLEHLIPYKPILEIIHVRPDLTMPQRHTRATAPMSLRASPRRPHALVRQRLTRWLPHQRAVYDRP